MARTFVLGDDLTTAAVELLVDPDDEELTIAVCTDHGKLFGHGFDTLDDAEQAAYGHIDNEHPTGRRP